MKFPDQFIWGAGTSSYQVEGASRAGGKGPSIWDTFCERPGVISDGQSGEIACDQFHRLEQDVAAMAEIGLESYRFSIAWPRILPEGTGNVNPSGLEYYDRLVDHLLENGIEPYVTLYHWDLPHALQLKGGWMNADAPRWFESYTRQVIEHLSDRVSQWSTFNEPSCFLGLGYLEGIHAPGIKVSRAEFLTAVKHVLLAHGRAVQTIREHAKTSPNIGYCPISHSAIPATESEADIAAAREFTFGTPEPARGHWFSNIFTDPVLLGVWPEEAAAAFCPDPPRVTQSELELMYQPIDHLALNLYTAAIVREGENGAIEHVPGVPGEPLTTMGWTIRPEGIYWAIRLHHERYGLPIIIGENGVALSEWIAEDGCVHDAQRIDFIARYLRQVGRAVEEGFPVLGYYYWSLLDNFEWAEGYTRRFGLIHVDFDTQFRTIKDSGYWYRKVIHSNGAALSAPTTAAVLMQPNEIPQ